MVHPFQKHREHTASHKRVKHILKEGGGALNTVNPGGLINPGYGSMAKQLSDLADVERFGKDVDMRVGANEISNPNEKPSVSLARGRLHRDPTLRSS